MWRPHSRNHRFLVGPGGANTFSRGPHGLEYSIRIFAQNGQHRGASQSVWVVHKPKSRVSKSYEAKMGATLNGYD